MTPEQLAELYGPAAKFSDHALGETVRFNENGQEKEGKVLYTIAPGTTVKGTLHGVLYVVEARQKGFPSIISPSDVIS